MELPDTFTLHRVDLSNLNQVIKFIKAHKPTEDLKWYGHGIVDKKNRVYIIQDCLLYAVKDLYEEDHIAVDDPDTQTAIYPYENGDSPFFWHKLFTKDDNIVTSSGSSCYLEQDLSTKWEEAMIEVTFG
jgi:hypothetical protein